MKDLQLNQGMKNLEDLRMILESMAKEHQKHRPIELEEVGDFVRNFRKTKKVRQSDFAELCGVSKNVLAAIEANKQSVKLGNFIRVTSFLGLKVKLYE